MHGQACYMYLKTIFRIDTVFRRDHTIRFRSDADFRTSSVKRLLFAILIPLVFCGNARGQNGSRDLPSIQQADSIFARAIDFFEAGAWTEALAGFNRAVQDYPLHRNTTAAALMAGKSAYRAGDYQEAVRLLAPFASRYPGSSYVADAERTRNLAEEALRHRTPETVRIGVVLSLDPEQVTQTQALFNGIHVSVNRANSPGSSLHYQLVFRDTGGSARGAESAVHALADSGVRVILGTLFSDEAAAAARAAEQEKIVFIAPLATEESVSKGRYYSFQANPTMSTRGRSMARFAIRGLLIDTFGIVAHPDPNGVTERLTDAFVEEASRLGAEINLMSILPDESSWFRLASDLKPDTLDTVEAVYVPVVEDDPRTIISAVLAGFDRLEKDVRLLGNSAWRDLPMAVKASQFNATYADAYSLVGDFADIQLFEEEYSYLSDDSPDRLAYTGFDLTSYLISILSRRSNEPLESSLRTAPRYDGLATRIEFAGRQDNQALFFHRYRDGVLALIR